MGRPQAIILAVVGALTVGGAGYAAGYATHDSIAGTNRPCAEASKAAEDFAKQATEAPKDSSDAATKARSTLNVVLQNPDCFSASERAWAQTTLQQADRNADATAAAHAACLAAGRPWFSC